MAGEVWDAPNQQVVRADQSGPGVDGGEVQPVVSGTPSESSAGLTTSELDAMTKSELLDYARQVGASPANNDMTKDELRAAVDAKLAEGAAA